MTSHAAADVRRAQILDAAMGCFAEKGLSARMDDIVLASGLSKGALYFHFANKDEIIVGIFEAYQAAIVADWDRLQSAAPLDALRMQGEAALTQLLGSRSIAAIWTQFFAHPGTRARMARAYTEVRGRLAETIERGIAGRTIRKVDASAHAAALVGVIEGLLLQALMDPAFDPLPAWRAAWSTTESALRR